MSYTKTYLELVTGDYGGSDEEAREIVRKMREEDERKSRARIQIDRSEKSIDFKTDIIRPGQIQNSRGNSFKRKKGLL